MLYTCETQEIELENELDRIQYQIQKTGGHLSKMTEQEYLELRTHEKKIARNPRAEDVPIEKVVEDLERYGSADSKLLSKAFFKNTIEQGRKASVAGRHGKVVYFGVGDYVHGNQFELGLLSAHTPGSSGGGGWGFNGDRRLIISRKRDYHLPIDPEKWLKNTEAYVMESYGGELEYKVFGDPSAKTLIYIAIEKAKIE